MVYRIGKLKLKNRFLLAPMLEPNDVAFRLLCKKAGCGLTYCGMTSPLSRQKMFLDDKPAVQLFGNSAKGIASFIKKYDSKVSLWDFNLGCPSKLSKKMGHGAYLCIDAFAPKGVPPAQKASAGADKGGNIETIEKILKVMCGATKKPVTIKLRKSGKAIEIAKMAEKYVDAIGIHARTASQGYSGDVDYDFALRLKKAVSVPVIYSGNVNEKNVKKILKDFDFVFVGREAIGDPGIFARLNGKKSKIGFRGYLKLAKKYKLFFRQIKYQAMNFTKGVVGAKKLRLGLIGAKSIGDVERVVLNNKLG
ncbi:tRNA-dihydrouridine synthase family protein [archaeon]|jgi:tRNA-dihydrouridine synthase B|nr:tRNA-dihydrouridine synthase family protein [archaeon]